MKKTLVFASALLTFITQSVFSQTCVSISRNSWEWPGHNNWFLPTGNEGNILDQRIGLVTKVESPGSAWDDEISGYQGVTCASDDNGKLLFFSNGIKAWRADGRLITDEIWAGRECGYQTTGSSAAHGVMTIRHPLTPNEYYIITIDDITEQGINYGTGGYHENNCSSSFGVESHGISYTLIDSNANLLHSSQAIETNITSGLQGQLRTTEDMAATLHANGVDIWITFHPLWAKHVVSYLLTCNGFVTPPVVSGEGLVPYADIFEGIGGLDFTQDGSKLAVGVEVKLTGAQSDSKGAYGTINLYDFDNKTGKISNRKAIFSQQFSTSPMYNIIFGPNGKWLHYSGFSSGKLDISSDDEVTIRQTDIASAELSSSNMFNGASITRGGTLKSSDNVYQDVGLTTRFSANNMYIPPAEEPEIQEVGPFCDTSSPVVLHTYWLCSGLGAEDSLYQRHSYFLLDSNDVKSGSFSPNIDVNSGSVIGEKTGVFDPKIAGAGTHKVVFVYCDVNDTTDITVYSCAGSVTGIGNVFNSANRVNIYPNPTSKNLTVEIDETSNLSELSISILGIQNNVVHKQIITSATQSIDVSSWTAGVYFLHFMNGSKTIDIRKIVVEN